MAMQPYAPQAPDRMEVERWPGPAVLEFGTNWCGYCRAAQPLVERAFQDHPGVRHVRVEDGPGRVLGRSFRVKLWPTLVFLLDGEEVARVVRPGDPAELIGAFHGIDPGAHAVP
ncbi:MAG: thioredoxin [Lysobacteraceae bacterium]|nr:MAG: thioredoxin [Xanthomonadaceae bacterium]